jgi:hypothetical protein
LMTDSHAVGSIEAGLCGVRQDAPYVRCFSSCTQPQHACSTIMGARHTGSAASSSNQAVTAAAVLLTVNGCWPLPAQLVCLPQRCDLTHQVLQHCVALLSRQVRPARGGNSTTEPTERQDSVVVGSCSLWPAATVTCHMPCCSYSCGFVHRPAACRILVGVTAPPAAAAAAAAAAALAVAVAVAVAVAAISVHTCRAAAAVLRSCCACTAVSAC